MQTGTSYSDSPLTASTTYHYRVLAVARGATSAPSNVDSATTDGFLAPRSPRDFEAVAAGQSVINVTWREPLHTDERAPVTGYRLQTRADASDPWVTVSTGVTRFYRHAGLTAESFHIYQVFALSESGDSTPAGPVTASTDVRSLHSDLSTRVARAWFRVEEG